MAKGVIMEPTKTDEKYLVELKIMDTKPRKDGIDKCMMFIGNQEIAEDQLNHIDKLIESWESVRTDQDISVLLITIDEYMHSQGYRILKSMQSTVFRLN
jgi:hypothetical protein